MSDADAEWGQTPSLRNSDFRKLLETPRPAGGYQSQQRQTPKRSTDGETPKRKPSKPYKPKPAEEEKEGEEGSKYRDRAKERREGVNLDYINIEVDLKLRERDLSQYSIEESKLLGGDVEHTHLVKGLDYALLVKERERAQKEEEEQKAKQASSTPTMPRSEDLKFNSAAARGVFNSLFTKTKVDMSEHFLPRRTAFVYEFANDDEAVDTDVPTTLRRPKADCPKVVESVFANLDAGVLERLAKIMSYIKFNTGSKKLKKKEKEELLYGTAAANASLAAVNAIIPEVVRVEGVSKHAAPSKPIDEDDDIFGDAGRDYKPATKKKADDTKASQQSYFGDKRDTQDDIPKPASARPGRTAHDDMDLDSAPPPPPPPPPDMAHYPPGGYDAAAYAQQYAQQGYYGEGYGAVAYAGGYMDPAAYQAYVQAQVAHQASMDPEYQALLQHQADLRREAGLPPLPSAPPGPPQMSQKDRDAGLATVFKSDETKWRATGAPRAEEDDDAYAECFPEAGGMLDRVGDSDEEDFGQMDQKGGGKSRYDFATEEEWQKYKQSKEANPKAAYQFGVKASDGRKAQKSLGGGGGEKKRDAKISNDLNQIERIFKDKGYEHGSAFKAPEAMTPSMPKKRQRI